MKDSAAKVSRELQGIAQALDKVLAEVAGERVAFTLLVFTEGRANYVSSASREDSVRELKELLALWESGEEDVPAHKLD